MTHLSSRLACAAALGLHYTAASAGHFGALGEAIALGIFIYIILPSAFLCLVVVYFLLRITGLLKFKGLDIPVGGAFGIFLIVVFSFLAQEAISSRSFHKQREQDTQAYRLAIQKAQASLEQDHFPRINAYLDRANAAFKEGDGKKAWRALQECADDWEGAKLSTFLDEHGASSTYDSPGVLLPEKNVLGDSEPPQHIDVWCQWKAKGPSVALWGALMPFLREKKLSSFLEAYVFERKPALTQTQLDVIETHQPPDYWQEHSIYQLRDDFENESQGNTEVAGFIAATRDLHLLERIARAGHSDIALEALKNIQRTLDDCIHKNKRDSEACIQKNQDDFASAAAILQGQKNMPIESLKP